MKIKKTFARVGMLILLGLSAFGAGCFPITDQLVTGEPAHIGTESTPVATAQANPPTPAAGQQPSTPQTTPDPAAILFVPVTLGFDLMLQPLYFLKAVSDNSP